MPTPCGFSTFKQDYELPPNANATTLPQLFSTFKQDYELPPNVNATTSAAEALAGAQFAIHAVPVQHTRAFLQGIKVGAAVVLL